jgi:hypothetical protein
VANQKSGLSPYFRFEAVSLLQGGLGNLVNGKRLFSSEASGFAEGTSIIDFGFEGRLLCKVIYVLRLSLLQGRGDWYSAAHTMIDGGGNNLLISLPPFAVSSTFGPL